MNPRHVTAHFAGWYIDWLGGQRPVSVDLIRQWAHRGHTRRVGTDPAGYALYDLEMIVEHARIRGILDYE